MAAPTMAAPTMAVPSMAMATPLQVLAPIYYVFCQEVEWARKASEAAAGEAAGEAAGGEAAGEPEP